MRVDDARRRRRRYELRSASSASSRRLNGESGGVLGGTGIGSSRKDCENPDTRCSSRASFCARSSGGSSEYGDQPEAGFGVDPKHARVVGIAAADFRARVLGTQLFAEQVEKFQHRSLPHASPPAAAEATGSYAPRGRETVTLFRALGL